jgi:hypothetical protein
MKKNILIILIILSVAIFIDNIFVVIPLAIIGDMKWAIKWAFGIWLIETSITVILLIRYNPKDHYKQ